MATITPGINHGNRSHRGFASMDPKRQREIASEGGRAAHEKGTAHEFTSEEAREAGRKGGQARSESRLAGARKVINVSRPANDPVMGSESTEPARAQP
jgi:uncharacterized protein